jgi:hypothetical protein
MPHYLTLVSSSCSQSEWHKALRQTLDERTTLLGLQETHLRVREAILAKEVERGLCHPDGCELPVELDETQHGCMRLLTIELPKQGSCQGDSYGWLVS